jgi:hypothetical protein
MASILSANRASLVRQNVMEKGSTQREAETNIDMLVNAVKLLGKATISLGQQDDKVQARVTVKLNP